MADESTNLTKLYIDLPNHWAVGGESVWARQLSEDEYEIANVPFFAYGLNFSDIVRAHSDNPNLKPAILAVVKQSGHRTLRIFFDEKLDKERQIGLLTGLKELHISWERADEFHIAMDVHPEADYQAVCDRLWEWEQNGLLEYETCEARNINSFDDKPDDDSD